MIKCHLRLQGGMVFPIQIHRRHLKYLIYSLMRETSWTKFRRKFFPKKPKYTMVPAKKEKKPAVAADKNGKKSIT